MDDLDAALQDSPELLPAIERTIAKAKCAAAAKKIAQYSRMQGGPQIARSNFSFVA